MVVVRFWPAHVHVLERGAVVGLLEQGVRPDAVGRLEAPHVGDRERRDLDVHAPDVAAGRGADLGDDAEGLEVGGEKERERDKEGAAAVSKKKAGAAASPSFPPLRLPQRLNKNDSHV